MEHLTEPQVIALRTHGMAAGEAFTLLEHAATCALCSERVMSRNEVSLQMASLKEVLRDRTSTHLSLDEINDFVEGALRAPEKARLNEHLAECKSCSAYVRELTDMARPGGVSEMQPGWLPAWARAYLTLPVMLGAAAAILLAVVLSSLFMLRNRGVEPQVAKVPSPKASQSSVENRSQVTGSQAGSAADGKTLPGGRSKPMLKARGSVLAVALMPGIVRGGESEKPVRLRAPLDAVKLTLSSRAELTAGRYRVRLTDGTGRSVWQEDAVNRKPPDSIVVLVPANRLATGRYVVTLSVVGVDGTSESLEEYALVIAK